MPRLGGPGWRLATPAASHGGDSSPLLARLPATPWRWNRPLAQGRLLFMSSLAPRWVTEEEFLALPESTNRVELLDGELIVAPSPSYQHQVVLRRIVRALEDWAETQAGGVTLGMAPLDVRFAPGRILQPDAFVLFSETPRDHEGPIDRVPALCVEVLSSNRAYDRLTKRLVYAEAGVSELWTVSTDGQVERWCGEHLAESERLDKTLTSPLLPGFALDLTRLGA